MGFTASVDIMHRVTELLHVITIAQMPIPPPHHIVHDVYVDNILVAASSEYCTDYLATLQKVARAADISLGEIAHPHPMVSHRGMLLDLTIHTIQLKPSKLPEIQRKICYAQHHPITLTMAEHMVGLFTYIDESLNPYGAKSTQALVSLLIGARRHPHKPIRMRPLHNRLLNTIAHNITKVVDWPEIRTPDRICISDASDVGFSLGFLGYSPRDQQPKLHILRMCNIPSWHLIPIWAREGVPLVVARLMFPTLRLLFLNDNQTLAAALNNRYSPSSNLHAIISMILSYGEPTGAAWLPSHLNFLDAASRNLDTTLPASWSPSAVLYDGISAFFGARRDGSWRRRDARDHLTHHHKQKRETDVLTIDEPLTRMETKPLRSFSLLMYKEQRGNTARKQDEMMRKVSDTVLVILKNVITLFSKQLVLWT
jgi:hypothetical protein